MNPSLAVWGRVPIEDMLRQVNPSTSSTGEMLTVIVAVSVVSAGLFAWAVFFRRRRRRRHHFPGFESGHEPRRGERRSARRRPRSGALSREPAGEPPQPAT